MNHKRVAVLVTLVAGAIFGCSDDDGPGQFRYPMAVGTEWYYTRTLTRVTDSSSVTDYSIQTIVRIDEKTELSPYGAVSVFEVFDDGSPDGAEFYQVRDEGLYAVASCGFPAMATPKRVAAALLAPVTFRALEAADVLRTSSCDGQPVRPQEDTPLALPYPIRVGQDWRYRYVEELDWEIRKIVRGWSRVQVPVGAFDAYQIEWYYVGTTNQIKLTDDVCSIGLLRRTMQIDSVRITTPQHPGATDGYETWIETLVLDSLKR